MFRARARAHVALALVSLALYTMPVAAGMYGSHVVELNPQNYKKLVLGSATTWLVKFYAPWCGHCKSSAPAFSKAAKKLDGVAKLGVVNCDEHKELCSKYGVAGFPTIKVVKGEGKKARRPSDYQGERSSSAFVDHAKFVLPSFIARVKESGLEAFFSDESALPHVLLFTDKKMTSPLYKGMSAEYRQRAAFGEVRKSEAGGLLKKFDVESFPKLIAFKPGETDPKTAIAHKGAMDPASLRKYLDSIVAGVEPKVTEQDAPKAEEKPQEPVFAQPKAYTAEVVSIMSGNEYKSKCGSRPDGRMCGLAFLPGGKSHALADELTGVAHKFQYDNLAFGVVDTSSADGGGAALAAAFGIANTSKGGFVCVRGRKHKFAALSDEADLSTSSVTSFLDRVVGGDARYRKLKGELPVWAGAAAADGKGEEMKDKGSAEADSASSTTDTASDKKQAEANDDGDSGRCGLEPPKDGGSCGGGGDEPKVDL